MPFTKQFNWNFGLLLSIQSQFIHNAFEWDGHVTLNTYTTYIMLMSHDFKIAYAKTFTIRLNIYLQSFYWWSMECMGYFTMDFIFILL